MTLAVIEMTTTLDRLDHEGDASACFFLEATDPTLVALTKMKEQGGKLS